MSVFIIFSMLLIIITVLFFAISYKSDQHAFIENACLPDSITSSLRERFEHLSDEQCELVLAGLKEYFLICNLAKGQFVAMPSKVVDVAWHAFILDTKEYTHFCKKAFGRFLHHMPATSCHLNEAINSSLKRTWQITCQRNFINASAPEKLPFLFMIDEMLEIKTGFKYTLSAQSDNSGLCVSVFNDHQQTAEVFNNTRYEVACGGFAGR